MNEIKRLKLLGNILSGIYLIALIVGFSTIGITFPNVYDISNKASRFDLSFLSILVLIILVLGFIIIKEFNNYIKKTEVVMKNEEKEEIIQK